MELLSREVALSVLCVVEELQTLGRPSTVALQLEPRSVVILSLCESTTSNYKLAEDKCNCLSDITTIDEGPSIHKAIRTWVLLLQ